MSFPKGCKVRFTPGSKGTVEVVKVYRRIKQHEPDWTDYVYDWDSVDSDEEQPDYDEEQFRQDHAEWEAEVEDMKGRPWQYVISGEAHCMSATTKGTNQDFAATRQEAMDKADAMLRQRGWVLVDEETA